MAVQQKTRTKTATKTDTKIAQAISVQQSQALAQTFVHASFSAIAFLRDLFPETCFVQKSGDELLNLADYNDYMKTAQRLASKSSRATGRACFETLVRGELELVDSLLDQIQKGAFFALQMKVLKALVISIGIDKERPEKVIESYTYTFSYKTSPNGSTVVDDITLKGKTGAITFDKAKYSLNNVVRQANYECKNKPYLPAERYITVRLVYNDDWDATLNIPGFRTDVKGVSIAEARGWHRNDIESTRPMLDAGYHGISLGVSMLQPDAESAIPDDMAASIPHKNKLQYSEMSRTSMVDDQLDKRLEQERDARRASEATDHESEQGNALRTTSELQSPSGMALPSAGRITESQVSTQTREDLVTRQQLDVILNPPPVIANGGDTQVLDNSLSAPQVAASTSDFMQVVFSDRTLKTLEDTACRTDAQNPDGQTEGVLDCECGCNGDKQSLTRTCNFCQREQHIVCYGYLGPDDHRLPIDHVCYKCLLRTETRLLEELKDLAILRKASMAFLTKKCSTERELSHQISCDLQTAKHVADKLFSDGYLRLLKQRGQKYVFKTSEQKHISETLFDPTAKIIHHLSVPNIKQMPDTALTTQYTIPAQQSLRSAASTKITVIAPQTPGRTLRNKRPTGDPLHNRETPPTKRRRTRMEIGVTLNAMRGREERTETPETDLYEL